MSLGIRGRLFVLAAVMILAVVAAVGAYVESVVEDSLEQRLEDELVRHARSAGVLLEQAAGDVDQIADRAGAATRSELWVFSLQGRPLGSSTLAPLELEQLAEPSEAPEVRQAATSERGTSVREDEDGQRRMFVAVKVAAPGAAVIARASAPVVRVGETLGELRVAIGIAGIVGVAIAAGLLMVVGAQVERALQPVVSSAAAAKSSESADGAARQRDEGPPSLRTVAVDLERAVGSLSTERNRFEAVLQTLEQAVLVLDIEDRVMTVNRAAYSMLSLPERTAGRTLLEAVRVPRLKALADAASTDGGTHHDEFDLPSGRRIDVRATKHADEGVVLVATDVTEVRHLERVRRDFVANVSHELRTPISVIRANAETLLDGALEDPQTAHRFVEATHRHADRLGRIVSDLLDISRIEAGRYALNPATMNVGEVVDEVLDLVQSKASEKGIELVVTIDPELDIHADRKAMEHILINLVSNAFKYTAHDGEVEVTALAPTPQMVRIEVLDAGPGIDPAHRERIFERFFRVDAGRSRDMGGTGLGLSIVKNLVEAQGGEVGVDPRSPRGSVFWFTLPAGRDTREDAVSS